MKGVQCALRPSRPCKSAVEFWWSKRVTEWPLGISQISSINSSTTKTRNRGEQSCKHCNFPASASLPSWGEGGILRASHPPDQLRNTFEIRETILLNSRRSRRIPDSLALLSGLLRIARSCHEAVEGWRWPKCTTFLRRVGCRTCLCILDTESNAYILYESSISYSKSRTFQDAICTQDGTARPWRKDAPERIRSAKICCSDEKLQPSCLLLDT